MRQIEPHTFIRILRQTLQKQGVDYENQITQLGTVSASEKRSAGEAFDLGKHVRGMVLSQLSNQRPWEPISRHLAQIDRIFCFWDPAALLAVKPDQLVEQIRRIRCGNRKINDQMHCLADNIRTLLRIEKDYGSLDAFVESGSPDQVAIKLSRPGPWKLKQIGYALALEYLRNVGIRACKPDQHLRRVVGPERLDCFDSVPSERDVVLFLENLSSAVGCNPTYVDALLWVFCAEKYGNVCGAAPRCEVCGFRPNCNQRGFESKTRRGRGRTVCTARPRGERTNARTVDNPNLRTRSY